MSDYVISCCSGVDETAAMLKELDIHYIAFHYTLNDIEYVDDFFETMPMEEFYGRMAAGEMTHTFQLNQTQYGEYFESFLKQGLDILHISISSGITGTMNSARMAVEELAEKYPERRIVLVDSISACSGYGLLVTETAKKRLAGATLDEAIAFAEDLKHYVNHLFFSSDLQYYIRGGRISKAAGMFAKALNICPLNDMDDSGILVVREKVRTKKKVIRRMVERMAELARDGADYDGPCHLTHSNCEADALEVKALIEETFPKLRGNIILNRLGPTVGAHSGPGTVALFFLGARRPEHIDIG